MRGLIHGAVESTSWLGMLDEQLKIAGLAIEIIGKVMGMGRTSVDHLSITHAFACANLDWFLADDKAVGDLLLVLLACAYDRIVLFILT